MVKVLFVCLGNICRSPTADGVFKALLAAQAFCDSVVVDSAGTGNWHVGKAPDQRAQVTAAKRGYDLSGLRARQVRLDDFEQFDYILTMDESNYNDLLTMSPSHYHHKIQMFLERAPQFNLTAVPDPYYDGEDGFETVLDLVEGACAGLLADIKVRHFS